MGWMQARVNIVRVRLEHRSKGGGATSWCDNFEKIETFLAQS